MPLHALVREPLADLREAPDHRAGLATQAVLGDVLRVLERREGWTRAHGADGYRGWCRDWTLVFATHSVALRWADRAQVLRSPWTPFTIDSRGDRATLLLPAGTRVVPVSRVLASDRRGKRTGARAGVRARLPDGRVGTLPARAFSPGPRTALAIATRFAGVPYLWGGTTPFGFDCSGLTQRAHALAGLLLPRDAKDQHARAASVLSDDDPARIAPGRLVFFGARGMPVTHVGIATGRGGLLHARGRVRMDSLRRGDSRFAPDLLRIYRGAAEPCAIPAAIDFPGIVP